MPPNSALTMFMQKAGLTPVNMQQWGTNSQQSDIYQQAPNSTWGLRSDGSPKGMGYLGALKMNDGRIMGEKSIGVNINGQEITIPTIVPTLSQDEIDHLAADKHPTPEIINKAVDHAVQRQKQGLSPYFD